MATQDDAKTPQLQAFGGWRWQTTLAAMAPATAVMPSIDKVSDAADGQHLVLELHNDNDARLIEGKQPLPSLTDMDRPHRIATAAAGMLSEEPRRLMYWTDRRQESEGAEAHH